MQVEAKGQDEAKGRVAILGAVSSWLKLLALVVLVGEAILITAMASTPQDSAARAWYPILMIGLLGVVVIGIFFDRSQERNSEKLKIKLDEDRVVEFDPTGAKKQPSANRSVDLARVYTDNDAKFALVLPKSKGWLQPEDLNFVEMMQKLGLGDISADALKNMALVPLGTMIGESKTLYLQHGKTVTFPFTDESSTPASEAYLQGLLARALEDGEDVDPEDVVEKRRELLGLGDMTELSIRNYFSLTVMDKQDAETSVVKPTLANIFLLLARQMQSVDRVEANKSGVLWGAKGVLTNLRVGDRKSDVVTFQVNSLMENGRHVLLASSFYSPQADGPIEIWDELREIGDSVRALDVAS